MLVTGSGAGGRAHEAEREGGTSHTRAWEAVCVCVEEEEEEEGVSDKRSGSGGASCWNFTWNFVFCVVSRSCFCPPSTLLCHFHLSVEPGSFMTQTDHILCSLSSLRYVSRCLPQLQ